MAAQPLCYIKCQTAVKRPAPEGAGVRTVAQQVQGYNAAVAAIHHKAEAMCVLAAAV